LVSEFFSQPHYSLTMWPNTHGAVQGGMAGNAGAYQGVAVGAVQGGVPGVAQQQGAVQSWGATAQAPSNYAETQAAGI